MLNNKQFCLRSYYKYMSFFLFDVKFYTILLALLLRGQCVMWVERKFSIYDIVIFKQTNVWKTHA